MVWFTLNDQQIKAIQEITKSDSQRIVAIVGCALLDQSLRIALELRLKQDKESIGKLFGSNGALGGQNKVDVGYLLYMFKKNMRDAMNSIYDIRIMFAHNLDMSFEHKKDERMKKNFGRLILHKEKEKFTRKIDDELHLFIDSRGADPQSQFIANLQISLLWLGADRQEHRIYTNYPLNWNVSPKRLSASLDISPRQEIDDAH